VPNSYILLNDGVYDSIATDAQACEIKPDWNAAVCKGDVGRLTFGGGSIGAPRAGGGGPCSSGPGCVGAAVAPGAGAASVAGAPAPASAAASPGQGPSLLGAPTGRLPPQPPVTLSRNGRDYTVASTNVRAGTEIKVTTERPSLNLTLTEMDAGSWVVFDLPGFTTAASGTELRSLKALRKASETSYFKDKHALWVKVVSNGNGAAGPIGGGPGGGTSVQVSR